MAGRARNTDPSTSHLAAAHVNTVDLEAKFIATLRRIGHPLTTTEIAVVCGYPRDSFSPRAIPLLEKRLIVKAAKRLCQNGKGNWRMMLAYGLPGWSLTYCAARATRGRSPASASRPRRRYLRWWREKPAVHGHQDQR